MKELALFPANGLANSVIPPVFVGLGFSTFFAETLGWNFSGLIVPGYLAPIFIVKPVSGIVIVVEAFLTYIILRILSDAFSSTGVWTRFFGQDAFFALFLISILVKSALEGPLLPLVGGFLNAHLPGQIDYMNEFHSTGLIVVPLIANIFWRHGIRRNLVTASSVIILTYIVTRFVLIPYTNFSVSKFELLYSQMALNFMESPRFYLILIVGTALASHNKYRYGWAYHGMLIPALLGIAWFSPLKILTTFIEAGAILMIGRFIVRRQFMRSITIEGPRKLLFLFAIGFGLKMILGFWLQSAYPGFEATDLYGFAYILPALLAMEMWPVGSYLKVTRVTVQTSLLAAVWGTAVAIVFSTTMPAIDPDASSSPVPVVSLAQGGLHHYQTRSGDLETYFRQLVPGQLGFGSEYKPPGIDQLKRLDREILIPLIAHLDDPEWRPDSDYTEILANCNLRMTHLDTVDGAFWIFDSSASSAHHGIYIFRIGDARELFVEIPAPLSEMRTLDLGRVLFKILNARGVFVSGTSHRPGTVEFDVTNLRSKRSVFQLMHQVSHRETVLTEKPLCLQIRGAGGLDLLAAPVLLSPGHEMQGSQSATDLIQNTVDVLQDAGINTIFYTGRREELGYSARSNLQAAYLNSFKSGEFAALWCSSSFRECFSPDGIAESILDRLEWNSATVDLYEWVMENSPSDMESSESFHELHDKIITEIQGYVDTANILHLSRITAVSQENGYEPWQLVDRQSGQSCIAIVPKNSMLPLMLFNLNPWISQARITTWDDTELAREIQRFILGKPLSLTVREAI